MSNVLVHLSLIPDVGPATIQRIIDTLSYDNLQEIYRFCAADFIERCKLSPTQASKIVNGLADNAVLERELLRAHKHGVTIVTLFEQDYPENLRQIYLPPPVLYYKGTLTNHKSIAVVGSRKANSYGKLAIQMVLPPLIEKDWHIVSGGALGADTFAHQAALDADGVTYAVLGSGLLHPYPLQNIKLFESISALGGAVISSFALNQEPAPGNFPARNRIIAGLSNGCLVVQAAEKSGASITARFALEQGKDVFVIPGRIDDPLHLGCHRLIQEGAKLVISAKDIFEEFNETASFEQEVNNVSLNQKQIFDDPIIVLCARPISFEELMITTHLSSDELNAKLFDLQIEGKIEQDHTGLWRQL